MMYSIIGVSFCEKVPLSFTSRGQFPKIFYVRFFFSSNTNLSGLIRGNLDFFGISQRYLNQKVTPLYVSLIREILDENPDGRQAQECPF